MSSACDILNSPIVCTIAPTENTPAGRRRHLAALLHTESFPKNFEWDFSDILYDLADLVDETEDAPANQKTCGFAGCALGLASLVWKEHENLFTDGCDARRIEEIGEFFGMTVAQVDMIFFNQNDFYELPNWDVTPEMVADKLDKIE